MSWTLRALALITWSLSLAGCVSMDHAPGPGSRASSSGLTSKVLSVTDGDTLIVQRHGTSERIRLRGIDCPEKDQPFGKEATSFTRDATLEHEVGVKEWGHDKYNRTLGDIILSDGRILNQELVRAGMCWWYRKYSDDQTLSILEAEAHAAHRGLWAAEEQVPPWEWRKRHKNKSGNEVVP